MAAVFIVASVELLSEWLYQHHGPAAQAGVQCCVAGRLSVKHALFVSFHYPPDASSSGVLRTLKYTRYLADQGWRATVLSPEVTAYDVVDEELMKQVPHDIRIVRTPY